MKINFIHQEPKKHVLSDLDPKDVFRFSRSDPLSEESYNVVIGLESKEKGKICYIPLIAKERNVLIFYGDTDRTVVKVDKKLSLIKKDSQLMKLSSVPIGGVVYFEANSEKLFIKTDKQNPDFGIGVYRISEEDNPVAFAGKSIEKKDSERMVHVYTLDLNLNIKVSWVLQLEITAM